MSIGVEAINAYVGRLCIDVRELFQDRGLTLERFENLMMDEKSVNLPCEDAITNAVNAAKPLVDALSAQERERIELLVIGTESGIDFGKPISTYVHEHLGLPHRCRSFEVKHACYGGTAALHAAVGIISNSPIPDARALAIATDAPSKAARGTYWEPSEGAGAVALLVGRSPAVLDLDVGASGFHTYEVMDTARPSLDADLVDSDLSLMAYLSCVQECMRTYRERVPDADVFETFDYLAFHTPFAGMVKGAHRALLRSQHAVAAERIDADFTARVAPSLRYPRRVGNLFSAALYLALCSLIEVAELTAAHRVGLFSYGSGCASEFYSGVIPAGAVDAVGRGQGGSVGRALEDRQAVSVAEYDRLAECDQRSFGVRSAELSPEDYEPFYSKQFAGQGLLVLDRIEEFHREYRWT